MVHPFVSSKNDREQNSSFKRLSFRWMAVSEFIFGEFLVTFSKKVTKKKVTKRPEQGFRPN